MKEYIENSTKSLKYTIFDHRTLSFDIPQLCLRELETKNLKGRFGSNE